MADVRELRGALVSALGAGLLAVAVFLPWYGVTLTSAGAQQAGQVVDRVAAQYGNASLQGLANTITSHFAALAGHHLASVTGHDALKHIPLVLLVLAGIALAGAVVRLAGVRVDAVRVNAVTALCGLACAVAVGYRMANPPGETQGFVSITLEIGTWLALLGSLSMFAGALWPEGSHTEHDAPTAESRVWQELSGWTPE